MAETKTISVKIDHKLYTALKTRAELDGSNVSDEIRTLLRAALAAEGLELYGNEVAGFIRGEVPVADIWKNYLAQAGELSRAGLGRIDEVKLHARERADG